MKKTFIFLSIMLFMATKVHANVDISAEYAVLYEPVTGQVIYEKNSNEQYPMASTTKIMTAIVAIENAPLEAIVEISKNAASQEGSSAYLREKDEISLENLLYGLMLNSGNDCAMAIGEYVGGNCDGFLEMMNDKAKEIGATNTNFKNPSGLTQEGHFTTPLDLAKIMAYAIKNEEFLKIAGTKYKTVNLPGSTLYFTNHNKLLSTYEGCIGGKTGYTKAVGRCLVSAAKRNGVTLIAVTLKAPDDWNDHRKMLDFGFSSLENKKVLTKGQEIKKINCDKEEYSLVIKNDFYIPIFKDERYKSRVELVTHIIPQINEPINSGEMVGYGEIMYNNHYIGRVCIVSDRAIVPKKEKKQGIFKKIFDFLGL